MSYVKLDRFVYALAEGWRFPGHVVEPMKAHHGNYCVCMEREESAIDGDP